MMHLINAAILNSRCLKQNLFIPKFEVVDHPATIVSKLMLIFEEHIKEKKIKVDLNSEISGPKELINLISLNGLKMDISLYEQIIFNVITNACKFNKENGQVKIWFEVAENPLRSDLVEVTTFIEDTGIGIDS